MPSAPASRRRRQECAAAHSWFAVLLFVALTLPTLQPFGEDDPWLGIGTVMLAVALATWLPLPALTAAVLVVWLTPFVASRVVDDGFTDTGVDLEAVLQLAGLLFLACGVSIAYRRLVASGVRAPAPVVQDAAAVTLVEELAAVVAAEPVTPVMAPRRFPGRRLAYRDAAALYERLTALRRELSETQGRLWGLVQDGSAH